METNENPPDQADRAIADPAKPRHRQIAAGIGSAAIVAALLFVTRSKGKGAAQRSGPPPPDTD